MSNNETIDTNPESQPPKKRNKAGVVLFGPNKAGKRFVLAPYTEGRFGNNDKFYGIAAGSVDAGEDALTGALREAYEETGVDFNILLGAENIAKLRRGEKVENVTSGYPGVRVKKVIPNALDYIYNGRTDVPNHLVMFGIEIEGIENLHSALKNQKCLIRDGEVDQVVYPIRTTVDDATKYPPFKDCIKWLRDQRMPEGEWTKGRAGTLLTLVNKKVDKNWFRNLEKQYNGGREILTINQWQNFRSKLPAADYKLIGDFADQMKSQLTEMGVVGKDTSDIKFDTKDCPFKFYQEGADIISAREYLYNCLKRSAARFDYNQAFAGATPAMEEKKASRMERITHAQLASVVWVSQANDIRAVADRFTKKPPKTRHGEFVGGSAHDGKRLKLDLLGVKEIMDRKVKPITTVIQPEHYGKTATAIETAIS